MSVYRRAAYLRLPGGLIALTDLQVPPGPVHARAAAPLERLRTGDRAVVTADLLQAGPVLIDLTGARLWRGALPDAAQLESGRRLALGLLDGAPRSSLDPSVVESAQVPLRRGDLAGVAGLLGGIGPGLTPAGDDCLAGILLVASVIWGQPAAPALLDVASGARTGAVAEMYLRWAARGQSIEPAHRFLLGVGAGDGERAAGALDDLVGFGHSSGADLALGLKLGLELLPPSFP